MQNPDSSPSLDRKGVLTAMVLSIAIVLLGTGILAWQYHQIEKKLPLIEEKIEEQKEEMEKRSARDVLDKFMEVRIERNEAQADIYLTEAAMEQKIQNEFILINNFKSYSIFKSEKLEENEYRFMIKLYEEDKMGEIIEVITLIKILDKYYIDSVGIAG